MNQVPNMGNQEDVESNPGFTRSSIKAFAILLFLLGLFLPFLAGRAYSPEYLPSERMGYEWLRRGAVESTRWIVRHVAEGRPSVPVRNLSWLCGTMAFLCLPVSLLLNRSKSLLANCLAGVSLVGVVWIFIKTSPSLFLGYIGLGFVSWLLSAVLTMGILIRARTARHLGESRDCRVSSS